MTDSGDLVARSLLERIDAWEENRAALRLTDAALLSDARALLAEAAQALRKFTAESEAEGWGFDKAGWQEIADDFMAQRDAARERAERAEARERDAVGQVEALLGVFDDWVIANEPLGFIGRESSRVQEVRAFLGRVETQNETTQ